MLSWQEQPSGEWGKTSTSGSPPHAGSIPAPDVWVYNANGRCLMKQEEINLCDSCFHDFATCGGEVEFGEGFGDDNVIACDKFSKIGDEV